MSLPVSARNAREAMPPIKVLVVDDSAIVRKLLSDSLGAEPDIHVVGGASDPFIARDMILRLEPEVLTLDLEMPRMDGLSFLRRLMKHRPMPVIVVSSLTQTGSSASIDALRAGAVDVVAKPGGPHEVGQITERIKGIIRGLRGAGPLRPRAEGVPVPVAAPSTVSFAPAKRNKGLIAIGASTGGPQALEALLTRLPAETPPIVIVQHMPAGFTRAFAQRLDSVCRVHVLEADEGQVLQPGTAYIAPGNKHLLIDRHGFQLVTRLSSGPPVHHQRPAVDVLFQSIARLNGLAVVGVVLTGMGQDGAEGLLAMRQRGFATIAEDERSCIVFGMPREAIERGAAQHVCTLLRMPNAIAEAFSQVTASPSLLNI
jgi:two-component system, chemotaxis family, protein-glutamate methylesterase/glutaminase